MWEGLGTVTVRKYHKANVPAARADFIEARVGNTHIRSIDWGLEVGRKRLKQPASGRL